MKPESRPRSEQGLASAVNLAMPLMTGSPRHPRLSTPLSKGQSGIFFVSAISTSSESTKAGIKISPAESNGVVH
jgi:hypothetical protein